MFEGVTISSTARSALELAMADRRLPHAIILEGTDEENRLKAAYEIAMAVVCSGEQPPCRQCTNCKKLGTGNHPDVTLLKKPEDKANYIVGDIKALKTEAYIVPGEAERKVYIFSQAQYLTVACQNMLLKLIEEPPKYVQFIFACPSAAYLLDTVRSRAPTFFLGETLEEHEDSGARELALKLAEAFVSGNEADFMQSTGALEKNRVLYVETVNELVGFFRDAILLKTGVCCSLYHEQTAKKLSSAYSSEVLMRALEVLRKLSAQAQYNVNQNLAVTVLCSALYGVI